jgi:hypothetical protein
MSALKHFALIHWNLAHLHGNPNFPQKYSRANTLANVQSEMYCVFI